jgi:Domain of unknown function (DUF1906)
MQIKTASPGAGLDCNTQLTASQCTAIKAAGLSFVVRYVPRTSANLSGNLTSDEMGIILASGLALMVVQHVSPDNWDAAQVLGEQYGQFAGEYAKTIGYPKGGMIWLDLEMVNKACVVSDIEAYCQAWYDSVSGAGYLPGLYVGWQTWLSSQQLYDLPFKNYWRGYNADIAVATRGYQILQHPQARLDGVLYDPNTIQADELGDLPLVVTA